MWLGSSGASSGDRRFLASSASVLALRERLRQLLIESGRAAEALGVAAADLTRPQFSLLGSCHNEQCGALAPRKQLKRCSACKRMVYCGAACQTSHWKAGHKTRCKEIQQVNKKLDVDGTKVEWA